MYGSSFLNRPNTCFEQRWKYTTSYSEPLAKNTLHIIRSWLPIRVSSIYINEYAKVSSPCDLYTLSKRSIFQEHITCIISRFLSEKNSVNFWSINNGFSGSYLWTERVGHTRMQYALSLDFHTVWEGEAKLLLPNGIQNIYDANHTSTIYNTPKESWRDVHNRVPKCRHDISHLIYARKFRPKKGTFWVEVQRYLTSVHGHFDITLCHFDDESKNPLTRNVAENPSLNLPWRSWIHSQTFTKPYSHVCPTHGRCWSGHASKK